MSHRKTFRTIRNQQGRLYEIPILILFFLITGTVLLGQVQKNGWAKGLLGTLIFAGEVLGALGTIVLFFWVLDWVGGKFNSKKPKDPVPPPEESPK